MKFQVTRIFPNFSVLKDFQFRDPMPEINSYDFKIKLNLNLLVEVAKFIENYFPDSDSSDRDEDLRFICRIFVTFSHLQSLLFNKGMSLESLSKVLFESASFIVEAMHIIERFLSDCGKSMDRDIREMYRILIGYRLIGFPWDFGLICQVLLLVGNQEKFSHWMNMVHHNDPAASNHVLDTMVRAFVPDWPVLAEYSKPDWQKRPSLFHALQKALCAPDKAGKEAGLLEYMNDWGRLMRPYGYKKKRHYIPYLPEEGRPPGSDDAFFEFAYEAALAVCAWDLDDSAFRAHPYYPRDLVDYYRKHVRHTRDAWRADGAGPGLAVLPPPPVPAPIDLAKSKAKGYARWLEIACDGDAEAKAYCLEHTGRRRSLKTRWEEALGVLAGNGHGVYVDLKDSETLQWQIENMAMMRRIQDFEPPETPRSGIDRCEMLLEQAPIWAKAQGFAWIPFQSEWDIWLAVMVRAQYHQEWLQLSRELGLPSDVMG